MITTVIKYFKLKLCTLMASSTLDLGRYNVRATAALCAAMEGDCGERADIEKGGEGGREGGQIHSCLLLLATPPAAVDKRRLSLSCLMVPPCGPPTASLELVQGWD